MERQPVQLIVFMMLAVVGMTASAQIKSGSKWNISNLIYEAKVNIDKTITFTAMAEGEELAFRLTPNYSKKNEFVLSDCRCPLHGSERPGA